MELVTLPIVDRELRVAARSKWLYRGRRFTAIGAVILGAFLLLTTDPRRAGGSNAFTVFIAIGFFLALIEGVRKTADCISEEKREGTLGLLFLTDLRPFDVLFGKMAANSIRSFQGLLAIFPIISITLVLGGVTGGEFWRATLMLLNTLFLSLSVAILCSTLNREAAASIAASALGILTLTGIIPAVVRVAVELKMSGPVAWMQIFSPWTLWQTFAASDYTGNAWWYWGALAGTHVLAWACLALTSVALPHTWGEKAEKQKVAAPPPDATRETIILYQRRVARRRKWLDENPAMWLGLRRHAGKYPSIIWAAAIPALIAMFAAFFVPGKAAIWIMVAVNILFRIVIAGQASFNMADIRRNGALELVLSTPLTIKEFVKGQRRALETVFFWPAMVTLAWHIFIVLRFIALPDSGSGALVGLTLYHMLMLVVDAYTVGWIGLWMGMKNTKPNIAFFKTVIWGLVAPAVLTVFCIPGILTDVVLIQIAHDAVIYDVRKLLMQQAGTTYEKPQLRATPGEKPPIIR